MKGKSALNKYIVSGKKIWKYRDQKLKNKRIKTEYLIEREFRGAKGVLRIIHIARALIWSELSIPYSIDATGENHAVSHVNK